MKNANLVTALRAGYALFYVQCMSSETERVTSELADQVVSFQNRRGDNPYKVLIWDYEKNQDVEGALLGLDEEENGTVMFAKNLHWWLKDDATAGINKLMVQFLLNRGEQYTKTETRRALVIVGTETIDSAIPSVLKSEFMPLKMDLPGSDCIKEQLDYIVNSAKQLNPEFKDPTKDEIKSCVDAAKGMGRRDIRNAFAYTAISDGRINPSTVAELKAGNIEAIAGLSIGKYSQKFSDLKGWQNAKKFTSGTIQSEFAKGVLFLGPPGTGKTMFCRSLGNETGRLVLEMELAKMFGSYVGESEQKMSSALDAVAACAPCILFIDELEKGLSGVGGGQKSGGNETTTRSLSQLLKFMSDNRPPGVYIVATCNDISSLPPEWIRPGRWDSAPFFVDLPTVEEREEIFIHYKKVYGVDGTVVDTTGWSGAEIESCCRIAAMRKTDLEEAAQFIVPISTTMESQIAELRAWAKGKTIAASVSAKKKNGSTVARALEL